MPTGIGLLFLAVGIYFAIRKPDLLLPLLLFSAIFPATSAITFGHLWLMPYYTLAPLFVVSQLYRPRARTRDYEFSGKSLLVAFGCIGVFSSFLFPIVFAGTPVYSPRLGTTDSTFTTFPLVFSVGNVAQAAYLTINLLVALAAATAKKTDKIWPWLNATFCFLVGSIFLELGCLLTGIAYPYSIIENTPDRESLLRVLDPSQRLQGTCGEPSYAGLILVIFVAAYFYRYYTGKGGGWRVLFGVAAIFLVRSSSALIAVAVVFLAILVFDPPFRFPVFLKGGRFARLIPVAVLALACLSSSAFLLLFQQWVIDKPNTGSYAIRTTTDRYSLELLLRTYGLGVGVGSYRPSSLAASLLGNVGIVGTIIFMLSILQVLISVRSQRVWLGWALAAGLIDMSLAIPDITHPILWSLIAVVLYAGLSPQQSRSITEDIAAECHLPK
jgi:hypothetical protein